MDRDDTAWLIEELGAAASPGVLDELHGGVQASTPGDPPRRDRSTPAHEGQRRNFANGPEAHEAAFCLHQALRLLTPQGVRDHLLQRATRRVEHRLVDDRRAHPLCEGSYIPLRG